MFDKLIHVLHYTIRLELIEVRAGILQIKIKCTTNIRDILE